MRTCVGWSQEKLATVSGVSPSAIAKQEQGLATPSRTVKAKLEKALGIGGKTTRELQISFGAIRAMMLDPGHRFFVRGIEATEVAALRRMHEAVRIALVNLRTMAEDDSAAPGAGMQPLRMGLAELRKKGERKHGATPHPRPDGESE